MTRVPILAHEPVAIRFAGTGRFFRPLIDQSIEPFISAVVGGSITLVQVKLRNGQTVNVRRLRRAA